MRKPHKVSGKLAGSYELPLASCAGLGVTPKRLDLVLTIDDDNEWCAWFRVKIGDTKIVTSNFAKAARLYDKAEAANAER